MELNIDKLNNNNNNNKINNNKLEIYNLSKNEMLLKTNYSGNFTSNRFIGPLFILGGIYGIFKGIKKGNNLINFKLLNKKLIISSYLNYILEQSLKYSSFLSSSGLIYSLLKQKVKKIRKKIFFSQKIKKLNNYKYFENSFIGFSTGMLIKSTKGFKPSLLNGFLLGNIYFMLTYINYNKENINNKLLYFKKKILKH
jgi:hypothetical protein